MTVSTEVDHNDYTGNGVTTAFPYTFRIYKKSDLLVTVIDLDDNITELVLDTNYTVTGAGTYQGGNVVLGAPLQNGWKISISRELPVTQETDLRNQGKFFAEVHEDAFDKLTMLIQQVRSWFSLALRKPSSIANWYDALGNYIRNVHDPRDPQDAATKGYVDTLSTNNQSRTLRTPEPIPALPSAEVRKNKIVGMDNNGNPIMLLPPSGSATDVLIELAKPTGAGLIGTTDGNNVQTYVSAQKKRAIFITDPPYNCVGDWNGTTGTDNWAGIQQALDDLPAGGTLFIPNVQSGAFAISKALRITKAVTIHGGGRGIFRQDASQIQRGIVQITSTENVFTLVASQGQWMFGQYGILDVHFRDIQIGGRSWTSLCARAIGVDTTVNGGDFHVRECTFSGVMFKYCRVPVEFVGIAYLNSFHQCAFAWSDNGFSINKGAASDVGGQTRFTLCTFDAIKSNCVSLNLDSTGAGGDFYFAGCTFADAHGGIDVNEEASVVVYGCHFENLKKGPESTSGFGLRFHITSPDNPSSQAIKSVVDNIFFDNDRSIIIDKSTSAFSSGGFNWPMRVDGNVFLDAVALEITQPAGHAGIDSQLFVWGASNTGLDNGKMLDSQISPNFYGYDQRRQRITRRYNFGAGLKNKDILPTGMVVTKARMYLTSNATSFTQLQFGDSQNNSRYMSVNAQYQALNTWVNWSETLPQTVINPLSKFFEVFGTAGFSGAQGIFEIEGYIP
ncbi:hypothetical protein QDQ89_12285 [Enterobacter hormaechei]|uniref:hypothetical protein n=1 Tax=Enterobacter hormaechei TaxID=158836 RepID=UPI003358F8EB